MYDIDYNIFIAEDNQWLVDIKTRAVSYYALHAVWNPTYTQIRDIDRY